MKVKSLKEKIIDVLIEVAGISAIVMGMITILIIRSGL